VEGFLIGLHRSPRFGFSQEFKEYRAYSEGDDPRFIDWNVYARTDRAYIKRYEGETNTRLMIVLDASASMGFGGYGSHSVTKIQYAKFLAAALAYLASRQHDPAGLLVFDTKLRQYRPPTARAGSLLGLLHAVDDVTVGGPTDLENSFRGMREHLTRRGLVAVLSDLYCDPEALLRAVQPLAVNGHDIMLLQILDPQELEPQWRDATLFQDMETNERINVSGEYLRQRYRERLDTHLTALRRTAANAGAHYMQVSTAEPLDKALRRYLLFRQGHN
jgi:uncharacterized protein (DUF58 family)